MHLSLPTSPKTACHVCTGPDRMRGFSLIELMIVVAIIGILAAIAYPAYSDYTLRSILPEASDILSSSKTGMDQFYLSNRSFADASTSGGPCIASTTRKSFNYSCTVGADGLSYVLTATGKGRASGFTYTINHMGQRTTAITVGHGWPDSANCWIFKKGDSSC